MKCAYCKYSKTYPESYWDYCEVFGDEVPDEYMRKDGEGCICNQKQLAKFCRQNEEAWLKDAKGFVEWMEGKVKNSELCNLR